MHASAAFVLAAAGFAAAQTTSAASSTASSGSTSGCGTQIDTIIASCLSTTQAQLNDCATNDWDCMCTQTTNVLTCYNNCPSDPNRNGVLQQQTSYCGAASAYPSTSTKATQASGSMTTSVSSASGSAQIDAAATTASHSTGTASSASGSAATPSSSTGAAVANVVYPGLAAALFGLAALV